MKSGTSKTAELVADLAANDKRRIIDSVAADVRRLNSPDELPQGGQRHGISNVRFGAVPGRRFEF